MLPMSVKGIRFVMVLSREESYSSLSESRSATNPPPTLSLSRDLKRSLYRFRLTSDDK